MCFVPLDLTVSLNFAHICEQLFKAKFYVIFQTDVRNYCEERKIKLLINVYVKISRNLGRNFLDFWQFFRNVLTFP